MESRKFNEEGTVPLWQPLLEHPHIPRGVGVQRKEQLGSVCLKNQKPKGPVR